MVDPTHCYRDYVFHVHYFAQVPAYSVDFPDCPEIITSGETLSQAFANACEARDLHLESCQKIGLPLPRPQHRLVVQAT